MKSLIAGFVVLVGAGLVSATDREVRVNVVRVEQPVKVVRVKVEQPVKVVREVKVVRVEQPVKVVKVERRAVEVEEVEVVESRRVGPFRAAVRAFFGQDDTVEVRRTVRVAR